ncbi:hypothetical protein MIND_00438700 [Mycena indigotica]|uniref:Ribosomal protein s17 n=1 Tax=Mycena indigotica TaxID=2126181 RepID=A0A8H6WBL5_9AGAR|nr:uncharacterized protein MIND_00438700 [Mycena indigotica]KAF7306474.1 hypothetical protein MIND_00438700 [Mycena indigotica]
MKTASLFIFGALVCSVGAMPTRRAENDRFSGNRFGGKGFGGGRNRFGNKGGKSSSASASGSASISASSFVALASTVSSAAAAASSLPPLNNAATNNTSANNDNDPQASLKLNPAVICSNFADNGQNPPVEGQSPSLTSTNNFINFCALTLPGVPLTNGQQIQTGSCNPAPIGLIPSVSNMPSAKFLFPLNGATIPANKAFNAQLNVRNFQTGTFTNAQKTYFAAPQRLNAQGQIIGHTHMVIETLTDLKQNTPLDPTKFFFFKGVDDAAVNGVATAAVTAGVPPGAYRICSINTSANHAPVIGPIAQHGSFDDCTYFTAK